MKFGIEAQETERYIYKHLETARLLQNIHKKDLAEDLNVTSGRVTQMYQDKSMTVKQFCTVLERLGLQIQICAK